MRDPLAYIYTVVGAIQKMVSTTEVAELNGYRNSLPALLLFREV